LPIGPLVASRSTDGRIPYAAPYTEAPTRGSTLAVDRGGLRLTTVRFHFQVKGGDRFRVSRESVELAWVSPAELPRLAVDESVLRMYRQWSHLSRPQMMGLRWTRAESRTIRGARAIDIWLGKYCPGTFDPRAQRSATT
jgi:hypothetical protein